MKGREELQGELVETISWGTLVPADHPLRKIRQLVDRVLGELGPEIEKLYAVEGRPSVPPEWLLRAMLLQVLYGIRSDRKLLEQLRYNLLFRWFVGMRMADRVWDEATMSRARVRFAEGGLIRKWLERTVEEAHRRGWVSKEYFSVDGTLVRAWASMESVRPKGEEGRKKDFRGERRTNRTHRSVTDPEARLYRKGSGKEAILCYMSHVLAEGRSGLVVDYRTTQAEGTAEPKAALEMIQRCLKGKRRAKVAADKGYDQRGFVEAVRALGVVPHVARRRRGSAVDGRTVRSRSYEESQRVRRWAEGVFGWAKGWSNLGRIMVRGLQKIDFFSGLIYLAYNLLRMARLSVQVGG